jgi:hypothetical protein
MNALPGRLFGSGVLGPPGAADGCAVTHQQSRQALALCV